jgi:hypothetical protein
MKVSGGYMTTREGEVVAHQVRLASESTRHKLARKLVILQKLVEPKEILRFEVVRALGDPPLTMRKYLALAIASSLEVAYLNPEMLAKDELNLYEQALDTVRALLHSKSQKTAGLIIRFNLEEGYNAVLHMLLEEIDLEKDAHRKTILVDILKKMQDPSNREALMREAIDRFVIR